jgi:broad specificity phosphatase PhoE
MARLYLVRHGEATGYDAGDPPLTELGQRQAALVADRLHELTGTPIAIATSPLRRARETAQPLAERWSTAPTIDEIVRELPSPGTLQERRPWLRVALRSTFADLGDVQRAWRDEIVHSLQNARDDMVVFTHAVVISAVVGHLQRDDRVLAFLPANTSVTVVEAADGVLTLVERGAGRDDPGEVG